VCCAFEGDAATFGVVGGEPAAGFFVGETAGDAAGGTHRGCVLRKSVKFFQYEDDTRCLTKACLTAGLDEMLMSMIWLLALASCFLMSNQQMILSIGRDVDRPMASTVSPGPAAYTCGRKRAQMGGSCVDFVLYGVASAVSWWAHAVGGLHTTLFIPGCCERRPERALCCGAGYDEELPSVHAKRGTAAGLVH
jgi:hypothetical protein